MQSEGKKSKNLRELSNRVQHNSSSTESDEQSTSLADDSSRITLHVITEKGQSDAVKKCFTRMTQRLDPTFDVVCVSERTNSNKMKNKRTNLPAPKVPALAVILFFMCDIAAEDPAEVAKHRASDSDNSDDMFKVDTEKRKNAFHEVRRAFSKKPWRFHHKVAVSGKLLCDSNVQDYFEFESSSQRRGSNGRVTPSFNENVQLPLWAVRRVHYGKQILRFNIFVSYENWEPQVELYTLILKAEGVRVRDDFCYFETFS
uniref:FAM124 domain-containing protein n=1 Tax=Ciona savignyi TaxID=51511 RepID=H2ZJ70_CIOSA